MKAPAGFFSALVLLLLIGAVLGQRPRPRKPTRRPTTPRQPSVPEPQEPTDIPPLILGPPSPYPDCPRECLCSPSYPNSLNCENRNIRVIPVIPLRTHYLYLQNNYISEVTAEPFVNASDIRWINLANNRIHRIDRQVEHGRLPASVQLDARCEMPGTSMLFYLYLCVGVPEDTCIVVPLCSTQPAERGALGPPGKSGTAPSQ